MSEEIAAEVAEEVVSTEAEPNTAPENQETPPDDSPKDGETKTEERTFTQKELDEILQKRIAREARKMQRESERRIAEMLKSQQPQEKQPAGKPTIDQFQTTEEYVEAVADWKADQKLREFSEKQEASRRAEAEAKQHYEAMQTYVDREDEAREKYPDYDAVARNDQLPISEVMAEVIRHSDVGPDVAYYLGKHPNEAARIANLPPILAVKEIGRIEMKVSDEPKTKEVTKAPAPVKPVGAKSSGASSMPKDDDPIDVWMKKERARRAANR